MTVPTGPLPRDLNIFYRTLRLSTLVPCEERRKRHRPTKELRPQTGASGSQPLLTLITFIHLVLQVEVREVGQGGGSEQTFKFTVFPSMWTATTSRAAPVCTPLQCKTVMVSFPDSYSPSPVPHCSPHFLQGSGSLQESKWHTQLASKVAGGGKAEVRPAEAGFVQCVQLSTRSLWQLVHGRPVVGEQPQITPAGLTFPSCGDKSGVLLTYPFSHLKKK